MKYLVILCVLWMAVGARAEDLPTVAPEIVGISSERLQQISAFAQRNVEQGQHAGMVTMVARHGKIVHFEAFGRYGIDNDKPMSQNTLFRIFSMTKPVTSVALMTLYEEGAFQMNDPVSKFLPALAQRKIYRAGELVPAESEITMEHLLTHTAGFSYGFRPEDPVDVLYREAELFESKDLDQFIERLAELPLRFEPGSRYHYSVATDVLGAVIEKISGKPLDVFLRQRIFVPLEMEDTFFNVPDDKIARLPTLHGWDTEAAALVVAPPEYNRPYTQRTLFSGGGGLVSSTMDYMIFCEMLRAGGSYNGVRILGPKTVEYMTINHLPETVRNEGAGEFPESHLYPGQYFGLGFGVIREPGLSEVISSAGAYSWGGAADTKFWVDPQEGLVAIVMTQLLGSPWPTRYQMKVATYQALNLLGRR